MKVVVATATTALLAIGVVAIGAAAPASAHTATLTANAVCTTSTGAAVVTWTVNNDFKEKLRVTESNNAAIPVGATIDPAGTQTVSRTFVENVTAPAAGKTISATVAFSWEGDNFVQAAQTKFVKVDTGCTAPAPVPAKTYTTVAWAMPSWVDSTHATFPQKFAVQKPGQLSKVNALAALDGALPTTCGTQYQIDVYNESAVTSALLNGKVLNAANKPQEDLIPGGWGVAYKLVKNPDCSVTPTKVVPAAASTAISCDTAGSYTLTDVTGVIYTVDGAVKAPGTYSVNTASDVHIVPSASAGYALTGNSPKTWDFSFSTPTDCQLITHPLVTPTATPQPMTCDASGSYTLGAVDGVVYTVNGTVTPAGPYTVDSDATVHVVATVVSSDYGFEQDAKTDWTFDFAAPTDCGQLPTDALTTPTVASVDRTCTVNGSFTLGAAAGVVYTVNGVVQQPGNYTVSSARSVQVEASTASSEFGFAFDQQTEWNLAFTDPANCGDLKTLAFTGSDGTLGGGLLVGLLFIMAGAGVYTASRIRTRRS